MHAKIDSKRHMSANLWTTVMDFSASVILTKLT